MVDLLTRCYCCDGTADEVLLPRCHHCPRIYAAAADSDAAAGAGRVPLLLLILMLLLVLVAAPAADASDAAGSRGPCRCRCSAWAGGTAGGATDVTATQQPMHRSTVVWPTPGVAAAS